MYPYYSKYWDILPHVILTSDTDWDTSVPDYTKAEDDEWLDTVLDLKKLESHEPFDMHGDYVYQTIVQDNEI